MRWKWIFSLSVEARRWFIANCQNFRWGMNDGADTDHEVAHIHYYLRFIWPIMLYILGECGIESPAFPAVSIMSCYFYKLLWAGRTREGTRHSASELGADCYCSWNLTDTEQPSTTTSETSRVALYTLRKTKPQASLCFSVSSWAARDTHAHGKR